jgi:hypothetical protein
LTAPEKEKASMEKATIIGIDLAKRVFQAHGAACDGSSTLSVVRVWSDTTDL